MPKDKTPKTETLKDEDIGSSKKISRRSLLATTGVGVAAGVTAIVAGAAKKARAGDAKNTDNDIPPTRSDPDRD